VPDNEHREKLMKVVQDEEVVLPNSKQPLASYLEQLLLIDKNVSQVGANDDDDDGGGGGGGSR